MTDTVQAARMTRARTHLLLDFPFWGTCSLRLNMLENAGQETLRTDGSKLEYNATYTATLTDAELVFCVAHETYHCALLHPYRMAGRDHKVWNESADYVVNADLVKAGLTAPAGALTDSAYDGMSVEQVYAIRKREQDENGSGGCGGTPSPTGDMVPAPGKPEPGDGPPDDSQPDEPGMTETDWQIVAEQAANVTRRTGTMSADVARSIKQTREAAIDWRTVLKRFVENTVASDYSWTQPDRRFISAGLYLPGLVKENLGRMVVAIDTSGSVDQRMLDVFASELTGIMLDARPSSVEVVYCGSRVQHTESFTPDDGEITLSAHGGGGTRFQPVFDHVDASNDQPVCLIYFTDLLSSDRPVEPGYPVLWLTPGSTSKVGPFGDTVRIPPVER